MYKLKKNARNLYIRVRKDIYRNKAFIFYFS